MPKTRKPRPKLPLDTPPVPTRSEAPPRRRRTPQAEVRKMRLGDIQAVYELGERLFTPELWPVLYRMWDEYELTSLFTADGDTCLVAELEDRMVGFALGQLIEKPRSAWRYGYLLWIGVEPAVARHGVGARLADELLDRFAAAGARIVLADTAATNTEALRFLRKLGFGRPLEHVYLSMNLSQHPTYSRSVRLGRTNGASGRSASGGHGQF